MDPEKIDIRGLYAEVIWLTERVAFLEQERIVFAQEHERVLEKEILPDRKRITRLEIDIIKFKDSLSQATATRTEGTWGIAQKRGDLIYARLFSMRNGNGKLPFLTSGDVKKILGVENYSQAKTAISECIKKHLDCRIVQRGQKKIGIELLEEVPTIVVGPSRTETKHRVW